MFQDEGQLNSVFDRLQNIFGSIEDKSEVFNVDDFTDYYQKEMGTNVRKMIISFSDSITLEMLPDMKLKSNALEQEFLASGKRTVNIDTGYLTQAKVVLATTKDYMHRIYLDHGIFADLHLTYTGNSFQPQKWTYPDYKQEPVINFFNKVRTTLRNQLPKI